MPYTGLVARPDYRSVRRRRQDPARVETLDERATASWLKSARQSRTAWMEVVAYTTAFRRAASRNQSALSLQAASPDEDATWAEVQRGGLVLQLLAGDTPWEGPPAFTGRFYVHVPSVQSEYDAAAGSVEIE